MAEENANSDKKGTYFQGPDGIFYYIEITLYNEIPGEVPLNVPFFLVESLTIHESLFQWYTTGEIVFNNDFEIFSRGAPYKSSTSNDLGKVPYIDRTDGRNRLHIQIYPVDKTSDNLQEDSEGGNSKYPKKYWEMDFDFVTLSCTDIPVENNQRKKKMYVFVDERYQILREKNIEWSSEMIASNKLNITDQNLRASEIALNPNETLKELLTIISTNNDTMPKINIGFDDKSSIELPNIPLDKTSEEWNMGDPSNLVIFYPGVNYNGIQNINYVLSHCISDDGYPVILDFGRNNEEKGWHLHSLSYFFKNSTPEQVERLIIEDGIAGESTIDDDQSSLNIYGGENSSGTPHIDRASGVAGTQTFNFMSIANSRIIAYEFSPMLAEDDNRIKNTAYVHFNEYTGGWVYSKEENTAKNVFKKLEGLGKTGLFSFTTGSGKILLNLNKTKTEGQMTDTVLALNGPYSNLKSPLNKMIYDGIFLNQAITFQCMGLTLRSPGKFIYIDKASSEEKNAFDDRFLGQWMITDVSHRFTQQSYTTEVIANKIDSFTPIFPNEVDKY